jgi:hypothetical protein
LYFGWIHPIHFERTRAMDLHDRFTSLFALGCDSPPRKQPTTMRAHNNSSKSSCSFSFLRRKNPEGQ